MLKNKKPYLIIDFDSTLIQVEALEELGNIVLKGREDKMKKLQEIQGITNLGMEGEIDFPTSLALRLEILPIYKDHIKILAERLKNKLTLSVLENKDFFRSNSDNVFIISGGFLDFILPLAIQLGLNEKNVLANEFKFNTKDKVIGFDENNFLAQEKGKVKQIQDLNLEKKIWVIGDGWTDYEVREAGVADKFIAFTENVSRGKVKEKADMVAEGFDDIVKIY